MGISGFMIRAQEEGMGIGVALDGVRGIMLCVDRREVLGVDTRQPRLSRLLM